MEYSLVEGVEFINRPTGTESVPKQVLREKTFLAGESIPKQNFREGDFLGEKICSEIESPREDFPGRRLFQDAVQNIKAYPILSLRSLIT